MAKRAPSGETEVVMVTARYLSCRHRLAVSWWYTVATRGEAGVRRLVKVCGLDVVEGGGLPGSLYIGRISSMEVDGVADEVMRSSGMVEVTVGADDDTRTVVLVDQTMPR